LPLPPALTLFPYTTLFRSNSRPGHEWASDLRGALGWSRPFRAGVLPAEIFTLMQRAGILSEVDGGWQSRLRLSSLDDQLYWHSRSEEHTSELQSREKLVCR